MCGQGERWSMLLESCVPDSPASNQGVPVEDSSGSSTSSFGRFLSGANVSGYADAFASVFNAIKGTSTPDTVYVQQPAPVEAKNNNAIWIVVLIVVLLLILVLLIRKK